MAAVKTDVLEAYDVAKKDMQALWDKLTNKDKYYVEFQITNQTGLDLQYSGYQDDAAVSIVTPGGIYSEPFGSRSRKNSDGEVLDTTQVAIEGTTGKGFSVLFCYVLTTATGHKMTLYYWCQAYWTNFAHAIKWYDGKKTDSTDMWDAIHDLSLNHWKPMSTPTSSELYGITASTQATDSSKMKKQVLITLDWN